LEDFTLEDSPANTYLHDICLCNRDTGEIFYDKLGYTYIELGKFVKTDTELETDLDRWFYVLKNMSRMEKIPVYLRKPIFEKLFSIAEYTNLTKEEKAMYDSSLKYKWDNKNVLDYAVQEADTKARKEERIKAFEEKIAIVREMKKDGLPLAQVAKFTKLPIEEIEKL
jgi:predicted transposase/invertase (TIGR01784 family)